MSKCIKCNQDLKPNEIPAFFDGLCKDCWNKKQYETYPFKKGIADKDQQIAELKQQLEHYKGSKLEDYSNEIRKLKQQLAEKDKEIEELKEKTKTIVSTAYYQLARTTEIIKLKEQLHTQPKEIVEKIKHFIGEDACGYEEEQFAKDIAEYLDKILKEYEEK